MNSHSFWTSVWLLAIFTLLIRASFFFLYRYLKMSDSVKRAFSYIPVAVLPALIAPGVFFHKGGSEIFFGFERSVTFVFAAFICYFSKSSVVTISSGMVLLFLFSRV